MRPDFNALAKQGAAMERESLNIVDELLQSIVGGFGGSFFHTGNGMGQGFLCPVGIAVGPRPSLTSREHPTKFPPA